MTSVGELMLTMLQAGIHTFTALAPKPKVPQSLIHAKSSMFAKVRLSRQRSFLQVPSNAGSEGGRFTLVHKRLWRYSRSQSLALESKPDLIGMTSEHHYPHMLTV